LPYAVTLDLDQHSAVALAPLIEAVERADPQAMTPRRAGIAPHISLAVYERVAPEAMAAGLERFAERRTACAIQLASLGVFPGPPAVVFAAPVVTADLLSLHRAYHQASWAAGPSCLSHYLPQAWVPHITIGEGLRPDAVATALGSAIAGWHALPAVLNRLSLVRFHPVELLWSTRLQAAGS
jgi:2'-5' RNA ligase